MLFYVVNWSDWACWINLMCAKVLKISFPFLYYRLKTNAIRPPNADAQNFPFSTCFTTTFLNMPARFTLMKLLLQFSQNMTVLRYKLAMSLKKMKWNNIHRENSPEYLFMNLLINHAFKSIKTRVETTLLLDLKIKRRWKNFYRIWCRGKTTVSKKHCCTSFLMYKLPCRHIFRVIEYFNLDLCNIECPLFPF